MDVLHGDLKSVEAPGLRNLDLHAELLGEVLQYDSVRGGKKREDVFDEVFLVGSEFFPV